METTTYAYDANGRLQSVTGPVAGATTTYTYDGYGRVRTVTDADSYMVTTDYDAFDRPTRVTFPDGTYEAFAYDKLDRATSRDRLGRITRSYYDALRRLVATRDPAGRVIRHEYEPVQRLIDANGSATAWEKDVQGRTTREVRANGSATVYAYEAKSSRLKTVTDPKQQVTTYTYALDDARLSMTYTNVQNPTPGVTFTYEGAWPRVASMVDGTGTTLYTYHPVGQAGATKVASVDGPLANDTIAYTYDELGRVTNRAINAVGVTWAFDSLGRLTSEANVLGTFTYNYDGVTSRVATVTYPNGQTSTYSYYPNSSDRRLQTIHHKFPTGATLSKFDYTYDAGGNIRTWRQQADTDAVLWEYVYDLADQLIAAPKKATDPQQTVLKRYAYAYDPAGNRTVEQIDDAVTGATYDTMNRLLAQQPAGPIVVAGTLNEPAAVTINGVSASVSAANRFQGAATVNGGTSIFTVQAKDAAGNTTTQAYDINQAGFTKTFTYDANGNLTADGTRTFEWDARNQLAAVNVGTHRSEFTYDGLQRRVRIVEKENSVVQSDTKVLWCDEQICEDRAADGTTVTRRALGVGEQVAASARFFAGDHLGSVTDVSDGSATLLARYAFDPWGNRTLTSGTDVTNVGYTGHRWQSSGSGWLTQYRLFDPAIARWTSEDPVGLTEGANFYAYVENRPLTFVDPDGRNAAVAVLHGARGGATVGGMLGGPVGAAVGGAIGGVAVGGIAVAITWPRPEPPKTTPTTQVPKSPPVDCPPPPENPCVLAALCLKAAKGVMAKARCVPLMLACLGSGLQ